MQHQNNAILSHCLVYRKCKLICIALLLSLQVAAQFTVTIRVDALPGKHSGDAIFVAGTFNNWNPDQQQLLPKNNSLSTTVKDIPAGPIEFKFTRGSWNKVESTAGGKEIENHSVQISSDTTLVYTIEGWKDDFEAPVKSHTTSYAVQVLDHEFKMPQLNRLRRIWIYLPLGYSINEKHYPVMYMQDGQNLFDELTSAYGEWGVDECLDTLVNKGKPGCIIVGIDNGGETRMSEYNPFEFTWKDSSSSKTFAPEGEAYLSFLVQTLKPYIDQHFRTLSTKENTIIAGSSMGGLISFYAALKYPEVFGKAGIFSPAFWTAKGIDNATDSLAGKLRGKYFFYVGGKEGSETVNDMMRIQEKLGKNSAAMIYSITDPGAKHNEAAWRKWFAEFYNFIMADGFNVITGSEH